MEISVRKMSTNDTVRIAELTHQLGYPLSAGQILENIKTVLESNHHDAFVAVDGNEITGWIGVKNAFQIETPPLCEIHGLVVDESYRNRGIGTVLIERAKQWALEQGLTKLRLRCNVTRNEAHLFYEHLGFTERKQQKVYEIEI